jgi:hypothetical protein
MNATIPPAVNPKPRFRRWVWIGLAVLLTPVLAIGLLAYSVLTLNANAATLRKEVVAATQADVHTRVQLDVGWLTLGTARTVLRFVNHEHVAEARQALAAVRHASVGVYEWSADKAPEAKEGLFARTDQVMRKRGLYRLAGVSTDRETVLVYASENSRPGARLDLCVAVLSRNELVIAAATVDADGLAELAGRQLQQKMGGIKALALN